MDSELITYQPDRVYIYALLDPRSNEPFYVGKTKAPQPRLHGHIEDATRVRSVPYRSCRSAAYISDMLKRGIHPYMLLVCATDKEHADDLERRLTARLREIGYPIQNDTKYAGWDR